MNRVNEKTEIFDLSIIIFTRVLCAEITLMMSMGDLVVKSDYLSLIGFAYVASGQTKSVKQKAKH